MSGPDFRNDAWEHIRNEYQACGNCDADAGVCPRHKLLWRETEREFRVMYTRGAADEREAIAERLDRDEADNNSTGDRKAASIAKAWARRIRARSVE